jgi:hypothetical protein
MAWVTPTTWTGSSLPITDAELQKISDDLNYLYGIATGSTGGTFASPTLSGTISMASGAIQVFANQLGEKVRLFTGYGLGVNSGELTLFTGGSVAIRSGAWNGSVIGTVVHTGNYGSGNGIDADKLDGYHIGYLPVTSGGPVTLGAAHELYVYTGVVAGTVTLPAASAFAGKRFTVKNEGGGGMTINTAGGNIWTTTAVASLTVLVGDAYTFASDGANWHVI